MFEKFKTSELIFITLFGVLVFIVNLVLITIGPQGSPQQIVTFPLSLILTGIAFILLIRISPKFLTLTLFTIIYAILEFPTPLGVAPGFWPKILINVLSGFLGDVFLYIFRYKTWGIFVGAYVFGLLNQIMFVLAMILVGIPLTEKLSVLIIPIIILGFATLTLGLWLGTKIWKKIKNKKIIKQISS
jgi:hypothetical protein